MRQGRGGASELPAADCSRSLISSIELDLEEKATQRNTLVGKSAPAKLIDRQSVSAVPRQLDARVCLSALRAKYTILSGIT
jgi:hypothetical protein